MSETAADTGVGPTVVVAIEQAFPPGQRLLDDALARAILPFGMRTFVGLMQPAFARDWMVRSTERSLPGLWGGLMLRKRFIDDHLQAAAATGQLQAVVNLGAGFDTRLYRLPSVTHLPAWELDQAQNIDVKRARLQRALGGVPQNVRLTRIDFEQQSLEDALTAEGFSRSLRTFYIWEAVTQYLQQDAIHATLRFLAGAAPGSRLALTYIRQDFLEGRELYGQQALHRKYVQDGHGIWKFGLKPEDVASLLRLHGWEVEEHLGFEDLAERWITPTGRDLESTPIERMVLAVRRG